jgi:hypothetical protein
MSIFTSRCQIIPTVLIIVGVRYGHLKIHTFMIAGSTMRKIKKHRYIILKTSKKELEKCMQNLGWKT